MNEHEHQELRHQLGSYALGHLNAREADALRAHLDGCSACRAELAEIDAIPALLDLVDPAHFHELAAPGPDLGERITDQVATESVLRDARDRASSRRAARRSQAGLVAAAAVVVLAVGGGVVIGRATAPAPVAAPAVPLEAVNLQTVDDSSVHVDSANLIAHTWGVELRVVADGFAEGETFRAAFRDRDGSLVPAGEFRGTGPAEMNCNLQSAELRDEVVAVQITNDRGDVILASEL